MISALLLSSLLSVSQVIECDGSSCVGPEKSFVTVEVKENITDFGVKAFEQQMEAAMATGQPFIPIVISSYGGSVYALLEMIDIILKVDKPIVTIVQGKAMSAGAVLASFGVVRWCTPNSTIMIHEVSSGAEGKISAIEVDTNEGKRLNRLILEYMSMNLGKDKDWVLRQLTTLGHIDWYLSAREAKEYSICTDIGFPKFSVHTVTEVSFQ